MQKGKTTSSNHFFYAHASFIAGGENKGSYNDVYIYIYIHKKYVIKQI